MADGATNDEKGDNYRTNAIMLQNNHTGDGNDGANHAMNNGDKTTKLALDFEPSGAVQTAEPLSEKAKLEPVVEIETENLLKDEIDDNEYWTDEDEEEDEEETKKEGILSKFVISVQQIIIRTYYTLMKVTKGHLIKVVFLILYAVYFVRAMIYEFGSEASHRLLGFTILGVVIATRNLIMQAYNRLFRACVGSSSFGPTGQRRMDKIRLALRWFMYFALAGVVIYTVVDEGIDEPKNLRSLPGLVVMLLIPLFFSTHPSKINWHTIYWSVGLQFLLALSVLKWDTGRDVVLWIQDRLDEFFANSEEGSVLLFGQSYRDHYMIFGALPIVFFANAVITALYYLGALQFVVRVMGNALNFCLDTSPVESMAVTGGIFIEGITSLLALRPYLKKCSKSQLFVVITSVFSSLGGAYLAILSSLGVSLEFLIPAMVVSAPATFAVCKLMIPETKWKKEKDKNRQLVVDESEMSQYTGLMDAAQAGATNMLALVGNVAVVGFAFFTAISWINHTLSWIGDRVGIRKLTIELISSYVLYPVALLMGIDPSDCRNVGMLLGYRIGINNIIAFFKLAEMKMNRAQYDQYMLATNFTGPVSETRDDVILDLWNVTLNNGFISDRSEAIVTYSLCGFSRFVDTFPNCVIYINQCIQLIMIPPPSPLLLLLILFFV
ncbi:solute carrier family 28 member 3 [Aplysia californica]|uniref:Solute carrier family 28 member 3 n=1 Tax=Aplysia californica TaxID=6500 RepID=A0ABM0JL24_APLCA|nr:solute carrier family 28 member 3 [Aplysia californica]